METSKPIPEGTHTVTPRLVLRDCAGAMRFYQRAFGAEVVLRRPSLAGQPIWHAEMRIGDSLVYLNDEAPREPTGATMPVAARAMSLQLYVEDCDAVYASAVLAGAHPTLKLEDRFWGDRMGMVTDPFGCQWTISTHLRHVSERDLEGGLAAMSPSTTPEPTHQCGWEPTDDEAADPLR